MSLNLIKSLEYLLTFINRYNTLVLVAVTILYTILTYKLSAESRNERRYHYLQKRLEYLYFPLKDIFSSSFGLSFRVKPEGERKHTQIGSQKGPEILRCFFIDRRLGEVKPYLYMSPPDLRRMFYDWAEKVSEFEDAENIWSEEEVYNRISKLNTSFQNIYDKTNEYIRKDEQELYSVCNGSYTGYLKKIKEYFRN
jgi:hypothetical protein